MFILYIHKISNIIILLYIKLLDYCITFQNSEIEKSKKNDTIYLTNLYALIKCQDSSYNYLQSHKFETMKNSP